MYTYTYVHTCITQTKALNDKTIVVAMDYKLMKELLGDEVPDLFMALDLAPDEAFQALACAVHECVFYERENRKEILARAFKDGSFLEEEANENSNGNNNNNNTAVDARFGRDFKVSCHVHNLPAKFKVKDFRDLKSNLLGRVVAIKGVIQKAEQTKPICKSIVFTCEQCRESILVTLDKSGNFKAPVNCETPKCKGKKGFTPDFARATTEDWRRVTLREEPNFGNLSDSDDDDDDDDDEDLSSDEDFQENDDDDDDRRPPSLDENDINNNNEADVLQQKRRRRRRNRTNDEKKNSKKRRRTSDEIDARNGQAPKYVEVELSETLVDRIETAGERVQICGIVRREECEEQRGTLGGKKTGASIQKLYVDAVSVIASAGETAQDSGKSRKTETIEEIAKFSEQVADDRLRVLVKSLCPSIYGHEIVKCGLLLCLFGGVRKVDKSSKKKGASIDEDGPSFFGNEEDKNESNSQRQQQQEKKRRRSEQQKVGGNETFARGTSHCLIVGDPGMGKSQMLRAASRVAPLAIHVSGKSASTAGLTATVSRDPSSGAPTFEAGAVALAHGGVCCVDEFDKMKSEHASLLEAMEQQRVSINKGGARASLPARTTILAAANPHKGRYDRSKSVRENLKMSAPLLSRFDLVFVLTDDPDEERDKRIGDNVTRLCGGRKVDDKTGKTMELTFAEKFHLERKKRRDAEHVAAMMVFTQEQQQKQKNQSEASANGMVLASAQKQASQRVNHIGMVSDASPGTPNFNHNDRAFVERVGLREYLERKKATTTKNNGEANFYDHDYRQTSYESLLLTKNNTNFGGAGLAADEIVSTSFMRKYVRYAKKYVHPTLSADAKEVIKAFYLDLRKNAPMNDSPPVTARQLESLVRLAEARARVDLRPVVTDRDAMDAVELYSLSMADVMRDSSGNLGTFGKQTGVSGKRKNFRIFIDAVNAASKNKGNAYFSIGELHALIEQLRLDNIKDIDSFIEALNLAGELLKCGRLYKSASFLE
jgi:DNA replicative helicase MCM subunit Mcm2 (Cdc46/Mcm family)